MVFNIWLGLNLHKPITSQFCHCRLMGDAGTNFFYSTILNVLHQAVLEDLKDTMRKGVYVQLLTETITENVLCRRGSAHQHCSQVLYAKLLVVCGCSSYFYLTSFYSVSLQAVSLLKGLLKQLDGMPDVRKRFVPWCTCQ